MTTFPDFEQQARKQGFDEVLEREWQEAARKGEPLAVALMDRGGLTDDEYARAIDQLGEKGLFELTGIIGWYQMIGLQLAVFRIMPPD